jgi:hypothetical protein
MIKIWAGFVGFLITFIESVTFNFPEKPIKIVNNGLEMDEYSHY